MTRVTSSAISQRLALWASWLKVMNMEYRSKQQWRGIPVIAVSLSGRATVVGVIAIGRVAAGVVSIGLVAIGPVALGVVAGGLVAAGVTAAGLIGFGLQAGAFLF
jgi:hypothetical protein